MNQKTKAFNWQNIKPVAILVAICIVVAAILGGINAITKKVISSRNDAAITESLTKVMEGGQFNSEPDTLRPGAPKTISKVYTEKTGMGAVVVIVTNKGYTGKNIGFTVGISTDGKITGMEITENAESIVPAELKPGGSYGDHYVGAEADDIADLTTGATVAFTESAIKNALKDAFDYLSGAEAPEEEALPRPETEIESLAKTLYGEGADNLQVSTPEDTDYVKRIYKENGKTPYVAYAYSISQYGTPEFELLILVGEDGKIKSVDKLLWKVSDAAPDWGYNPPSDDEVDTLFGSLVDKDSDTITDVDIVTGATNTAGKLRDAAAEALAQYVPAMPKLEAEVEALAKTFYGEGADNLVVSVPENTDFVKRIYKENDKSSFVAYAFSISQYGTPEFELLILVGEDGKIAAVEKIIWKVSDAAPDWGYNPPSDDEVDALFDSLVDKNKDTISSVDIETGATNTAGKLRDAAEEALELYSYEIPREISEIEAFAKELYGDEEATLECTELEGYDYAALKFKEADKKSYVAYCYSISQYGTPEFEFLVLVGEDGKIAAVKTILWKVSDAKPEWGYNPPSEDEVATFFESFVGKNDSSVSDVDIETGATNTAGNVRDAVIEALGLFKPEIPRDVSEIEAFAKELYGNSSATLEYTQLGNDYEYAGLIFKENGKKSYVVYSYSISQYGTPEFEFLVLVGEDGKIAAVKTILWKVSDAKPEWGYNPPSDDEVAALFESFVGKDASTAAGVDVQTGATNTASKLRDAVVEAIEIGGEAVKQSNAPRIVGIAILAIGVVAITAYMIENKKRRAGK